MNYDTLTTILGIIAVACGTMIASHIGDGTILNTISLTVGGLSGVVFSYFTNKPNPFKKAVGDE